MIVTKSKREKQLKSLIYHLQNLYKRPLGAVEGLLKQKLGGGGAKFYTGSMDVYIS